MLNLFENCFQTLTNSQSTISDVIIQHAANNTGANLITLTTSIPLAHRLPNLRSNNL